MSDLSRRDFLKVLRTCLLYVSGALAAGGLLRFLDPGDQPPTRTEFNLGPAAAYAPGSRTVLAQVPAVLLHTPAGFKALSLTCTHLGCSLAEKSEGFACACHGSRFDRDGKSVHGPARGQLSVLRTELTADGELRLIKEA